MPNSCIVYQTQSLSRPLPTRFWHSQENLVQLLDSWMLVRPLWMRVNLQREKLFLSTSRGYVQGGTWRRRRLCFRQITSTFLNASRGYVQGGSWKSLRKSNLSRASQKSEICLIVRVVQLSSQLSINDAYVILLQYFSQLKSNVGSQPSTRKDLDELSCYYNFLNIYTTDQ